MVECLFAYGRSAGIYGDPSLWKAKGVILFTQLSNLEPAVVQSLEAMPAQELLQDLAGDYRLQFQQRRLRNKWEVGLARSFSLQPRSYPSKDAAFPAFLMIPVLRDCLLLSGEGERVTGFAMLKRLAVRPIRKSSPGVALTTGTGFQLDHLPDGWAIKLMVKRTTRLTNEMLDKLGAFSSLSSSS